MGYDNENNQVDDEAGKERKRVEDDLRRAVFGSDTAENNSRLRRSPEIFKAILIADEKKRKKDESERREAFKRAQELIDRINEQITEYNKRIREFEKDAAELAWARKRLEKGDSLKDVLKDKDILKLLDDYQRRTGSMIDMNDRDAVKEALRMEQEYRLRQAEEWRERVRELEKGRERIEKALADGRPDLLDHVDMQKMEDRLAQGTSASVQDVWRDQDASEEIKEIAGIVNTDKINEVVSTGTGSSFMQFAGSSFAAKAGIGEGMETKIDNIKFKFAKAVELDTPKTPEVVATNNLDYSGPKLPG
ncbi:MAG TPA: hypothetical protein DEA55_05615 [Rhodospirillaceae bacterium]|nr:hypothetical protein [Rhodospirillaceae bacterium]